MSTVPSSYLLILVNPKEQERRVGCLGRIGFAAGLYVYVGSGGPNAVKRIHRYTAPQKRLRWHIDYLSSGADRMRTLDCYVLPRRRECGLAGALSRRLAVVRGFGSSDCCCAGHLFYAGDILVLVRELGRAFRAGRSANG